MADLQFGLSSYDRLEGNLPELPVTNMYAEEAPTEKRGVMLQSRPSLVEAGVTMGAGPVQALFQRDGVLGGALLGVSDGSLYNGATLVGPIDGNEHVSIAGNETGIMVTAGQTVYHYDGTTLAPVAFPDGADVAHVFVGGQRFWFIRKGTGQIYWTNALATTVDPLNFATAESSPDGLLQGLWLDDMAVLFGTETVEFWPNTGDDNLPIQPLEGRVIERGIRATGCAVVIGPTIAWITNHNEVCIGDENNIISNIGLQERLEDSATASAYRFFIDGVEFLGLRLDGETQVWCRRSGQWSEFQTHGLDNWRASGAEPEGGQFFSPYDGEIYEWGDADSAFERRWRAGMPIDGGSLTIKNLRVRCNPGQTRYLQGVFADPTIELRTSRDQGQTWSKWRQTSLGVQGKYRERIEWRGLGLASQPAFLAEFRVTDPVPLRVSNVTINEPVGGR